jgi:hypothetical protein
LKGPLEYQEEAIVHLIHVQEGPNITLFGLWGEDNKGNKRIWYDLGNKNDTIRTIKKQSDLDSYVKYIIVQFHGNNYNSQSDRWIGLKLYMESPDMLSYLGLIFQVNRSLRRYHNMDQ